MQNIFIIFSIFAFLVVGVPSSGSAACGDVNLQTSYVPHPNGNFRIGLPSKNLEQNFSTESNEGQVKIRHFNYESFNKKTGMSISLNLSIIDDDILAKAKEVSFDVIFSDSMGRGITRKSGVLLYRKKNLVIDGWDGEEFAVELTLVNGKNYLIVRNIFQENNLYTLKALSDCMDNSRRLLNSFRINK
jgi:hypothetical protein